MKNIIITCGTSIFTNLLDEDFYKLSGVVFSYTDFKNFKDDIKEINKQNTLANEISINFDDEMGEGDKEEKIKKYLIDGFKDINIESDFFSKLSAEISLILNGELKLNKTNDKIFLFYSDNLAGQLVSEVLLYIFKYKIGINNVETNKIPGFKVDDKTSFKEIAIPDFFKKLEEIKQKLGDTIMCPVGGYKALIPYASLYAMVNGWEIKYIYEDSEELMDLPNGVLSYFIYQNMIGNSIKLEESLTKNTKFNLEKTLLLGKFVSNFKKFGYVNDINNLSNILVGENPAFENSLKLLKNTIDFVGINNIDLKTVKTDLKGLTNRISKKDDIENMFFNDIINDIKDNFLDSTVDGRFVIMNWYLSKNRILESYLILRELFLDIFSYYIFGEIKLKENDRKKVDYRGLLETQLYLFFTPDDKSDKKYLEDEISITLEEKNKICELYKLVETYENNCLLKEAYNKAKDVRNILAHIGKQNKDFYSKLGNIIKYAEVLETFKNHILNQKSEN
ncbi:MAG: hypothetical protein Q8K30_05105 [Candidatus Gracilibacteria bacterium]|nr:hypothetical protein [Candidatus Gracilibacteria bacterium]